MDYEINSPFDPNVAPVRQSNPARKSPSRPKPVGMEDETAEKGEIALVYLGAFNLGAITEEELPVRPAGPRSGYHPD